MPARIGMTKGTQAYHHLLSPLWAPSTDFGKSQWIRRGPKSRPGLSPGPVGPPRLATNTMTRKPSAMWAIARPGKA
jgi:hypothetical protein